MKIFISTSYLSKTQVDDIRKQNSLVFTEDQTQRKNTVITYTKLFQALPQELRDGLGLDYSAGLGMGTKKLKELGANIESYEPFPKADTSVDYRGFGSLPKKKYDYIINSAVLNVVTKADRDKIVKDMWKHLKDHGQLLIGARTRSQVFSAKSVYKDEKDGEIVATNGSYQKGFTQSELEDYVKSVLPQAQVMPLKGVNQVAVRVGKSIKIDLNEQLHAVGLKRSKMFGVGKEYSGSIYVHRTYEDNFPVKKAKKHLPPNYKYDVVKYTPKTGAFSFIKSPDFDTNPEPANAGGIMVTSEGRTSTSPDAGWIYHHKWAFVKDDYQGFDVDESKRRSLRWYRLPGIDFNRIGQRSHWEREVLPRLT